MTTISSHVLDSTIGDHAKWIRIECIKISADGNRHPLFNAIADDQGRISETIAVTPNDGAKYEMIFYSAEYFTDKPSGFQAGQIMPEVVVRFLIPNPAKNIHIPIMLAPHQYSIWWSA
ncbi:MAG: hydroxyisourate hydrolase [Anaerolineae bacterium]